MRSYHFWAQRSEAGPSSAIGTSVQNMGENCTPHLPDLCTESGPFLDLEFALDSGARGMAAPDSGSQKMQYLFDGFKVKSLFASITNQVPTENSADLERAPGARSIGAYFVVGT